MTIVDFSIRRPVTVFVFVLAAVVFGLVAFDDLAVDLLPRLPILLSRFEPSSTALHRLRSKASSPRRSRMRWVSSITSSW